MVAAAKLPVLNPGEFYLWKIRIEQYFLMIDYALCEVIVNGDSPSPKRTVDGVEQTYPPTTAEEKLARKNELKARGVKENLEDTSKETVKSSLWFNSANTDSMSDAVIYSFFANQSNSPQLNDENLQQIDADDLEEMDLKWQMAMFTIRARRFLNKTGRRINANCSETIGFNKSKVECYNYGLRYDWSDQAEEGPTNFALMAYTSSGAYKAGLEYVEARLDVYKKNEVVFEEDIKILKLDIKLRDNALTKIRKKFEKAEKERDDLKLTLGKFRNSSKNLSKLLEIQVSDKFKTGVGFNSRVVDSQVLNSQENDRYKTSEGYHAVPPPYIGNFMPPKYDLVLADEGEYVFNESLTSIPDVVTSEAKTSVSKPKSVSEPLIEDWISDSDDKNETEFKSKQRKPSFAKHNLLNQMSM
ncbi:hypothetical protein Tco_1273324 [Tanacetum coccineum]